MNRGAWQATVHGVAKSWIQLSDLARMHARMTHQEIPTHRLAYCLATKKKSKLLIHAITHMSLQILCERSWSPKVTIV